MRFDINISHDASAMSSSRRRLPNFPDNNTPTRAMPGSFINDYSPRPSFIDGEIIDLTGSPSNDPTLPEISNPEIIDLTDQTTTNTTSDLISATINLGLQKLNEKNIPSHVSQFILKSSQKAAEVDWFQVSQDIITWVQTHPQEAKAAGYAVAGGVVFFKPKLLPRLAWEAWKVKTSGLGACEFKLSRIRVGLLMEILVVNPFSGVQAGLSLAVSAAAALVSGAKHGGDGSGEDEESDLALLTRTAYKLAMRRIKRAKRKARTRRRR